MNGPLLDGPDLVTRVAGPSINKLLDYSGWVVSILKFRLPLFHNIHCYHNILTYTKFAYKENYLCMRINLISDRIQSYC